MSALTDNIDQKLGARFAEIVAAERAYFAATGEFCQLPKTNSFVPADGEDVVPDGSDQTVSNVGIRWSDLGQLPATMQSQLEVFVYEGPDGPGFIAIVRVFEAGALMEKRVNVGPETWQGSPWKEVNEPLN